MDRKTSEFYALFGTQGKCHFFLSDLYAIFFVENEILQQHCTFLIIAQLTGLLPDFYFHYNGRNGSYYLDVDLFTPTGQKDLSF